MNSNGASEEILEIVDENDRVIGTERRGVIHAQGLMHRSAQVMVFNSRGELFLQKRSDDKDEFPGLWDSSVAGRDGCPGCRPRGTADTRHSPDLAGHQGHTVNNRRYI